MPCSRCNWFKNTCSALQVGHQVAQMLTNIGSSGKWLVDSPDSTVFKIKVGKGLSISAEGNALLSSWCKPIQNNTPMPIKMPKGRKSKSRFIFLSLSGLFGRGFNAYFTTVAFV